MEAKFCLSLLLIILGTLAVQGARLENELENPLHDGAKRSGTSPSEYFFALMTNAFDLCFLFICSLTYV